VPLEPYEDVAKEPLAFPINGKTYTPPPISAKGGIYLMRALAGDPEVAEQPSQSLWQVLLGPVYDEMVADDVPLDALGRAGFAMLVDFQNDREAAERVWRSGIDPEAQAALTTMILQSRPTQPPARPRPPAKKAAPKQAAKSSRRRR
jgi:hypothetical protein